MRGSGSKQEGARAPIIWSKFKDTIEEQRVLFDNPEHLMGIEILAKESDKYRISKGLNPKIPT